MDESPHSRAHRGPVTAASPDPAPRLRRATPADAAALAAFAAAQFRATYGPGAPPDQGGGSRPEDVEAYVGPHFHPARQAEELADAALATFVAEANGALAGYVQVRAPSPHALVDASAGPRAAEVARLYVAAEWRGRGLAAELMAAAVAHARAAGAPALWLAAQQRNARAVAFYRRQGFAVAGDAHFQMGAERQDDWIMVRPLS